MPLDIKKAVIHILNRDSNEPLLNEFELDINEDLYSFLDKHITKSINADESRKAVFREGLNVIREVCTRVGIDNSYFLEGSREIARQLFKAMKTNNSISSTDLIVCLYEDSGQHFIAILKMDYTTSFIHEVEIVDQKFKISIKKQEISLPGVGQKIQKCAFVRCGEDDGSYNLIILDNQINSKNVEEPVAQFFLQTFLGAELILDGKACTRIFKTETENWIRSKTKEGEASAELVREFVNTAIREDEQIDIQDFSQKAFGNKVDLREDYLSNMKEKGLGQQNFEIDKDWVERRLSKVRIRTDSNIEIVVNYEDFSNKEKLEIVRNPDGTRSILIKNIISIMEK